MFTKSIAAITAMACTVSTHAQYTIKSPRGIVSGVSASRIESTDLPKQRLEQIKAQTFATLDVAAHASDVRTSPGKQTMAISTHTACFDTFLHTEGDYSFILDVGGRQTVVSDHIDLPQGKRTCVTHELYQQVNFPSQGNFMYTATSKAWTMTSGVRTASSNAFIIVN